MIPVIYIDLDGVLADLHTGVVNFTGDEFPENHRSALFKEYLPAYVEAEMFYLQDKMPKADNLVKYLLGFYNKGLCQLAILTSSGQFYKPISRVTDQKKRWIEKNIPEFSEIPFCTTTSGADKSILANENAFLLDDYPKNVTQFIAAGGHGHVYHEDTFNDAIESMIKFLERFEK